jgi:hypothetical protein
MELKLSRVYRFEYSETNSRCQPLEVDGAFEMRGYGAFRVKLRKCNVFLSHSDL